MCSDDGLPKFFLRHSAIARRTSGATGVVALLSRYTRLGQMGITDTSQKIQGRNRYLTRFMYSRYSSFCERNFSSKSAR